MWCTLFQKYDSNNCLSWKSRNLHKLDFVYPNLATDFIAKLSAFIYASWKCYENVFVFRAAARTHAIDRYI